ncbi:MAG TPA: hypothetical protein VIY90_21220 [Steroidobacteraceae bacterium]
MTDVVIYFLTTVLAIGGLVGGLDSKYFGAFSDPTYVSFASFATSLLVLLLGDRIAAGTRESVLKRDLARTMRETLAGVPEINTIFEFPTSDDAMEYLCSRIPSSRVILNTKISAAGVEPRRHIGERYSQILTKALESGLVCKDVISPIFQPSSEFLRDISGKRAGSYQFKVMADQPPCFLNFIVLEYETGQEELLIGWATSAYMGTEQKAFKIQDNRVIDYFKSYHASLFTA